MIHGCGRRRRLRIGLWLGALTALAAGLPAASPASEPTPAASATARLQLVVPSPAVRRDIARLCRDRPQLGYVPIVRVPAEAGSAPPTGRFVDCASGDVVFVVPVPR